MSAAMIANWQDLLAIGLVLAAAGYISRRAWLVVANRGKAGCGTGCAKCPTAKPAAAKLVQIERVE
jgi:hypothetical protein